MIGMESESGGGEDFVAELVAQSRERAEVAVWEGAQHLRNRTVQRLSGGRSGRTYYVPGAMNATYTASSPGQAPASATGKLRQNINAEAPRWSGDEIASRVGVDIRVVPYARRLEFGGLHVQARDQVVRGIDGFFMVKAGTVIRTAPRPYLRPTLDAERTTIERMMQDRLDTG